MQAADLAEAMAADSAVGTSTQAAARRMAQGPQATAGRLQVMLQVALPAAQQIPPRIRPRPPASSAAARGRLLRALQCAAAPSLLTFHYARRSRRIQRARRRPPVEPRGIGNPLGASTALRGSSFASSNAMRTRPYAAQFVGAPPHVPPFPRRYPIFGPGFGFGGCFGPFFFGCGGGFYGGGFTAASDSAWDRLRLRLLRSVLGLPGRPLRRLLQRRLLRQSDLQRLDQRQQRLERI